MGPVTVRFLSEYSVDVLRKRIREAIVEWRPEELFVFHPFWEALRPALELPLDEIVELSLLGGLPDKPAPRGWNFAAEQMHNYAVPKIALLMVNSFAQLLLEAPSGEISQDRIREVIKAYASRTPVPGSSEQEVVTRLTPLLWIDFRNPSSATLTYTPETFSCLDSDSRKRGPIHVPIEELEVWRQRGKKRWLFLDGIKKTVAIGTGKARRTFRLSRLAFRLLRELLLRVPVGAVERSRLHAEVWSRQDVEPGTFREAFSDMHKQTGGLLEKNFRLRDDPDAVTIEMSKSFLAIWLASEGKETLT